MKLGFLYAGQGSQHPGMGADLYEAFPSFRQVLDHAPVDFDLKEVSFQDRENRLDRTRFTQPCMAAFAAGLTAVLRERGIRPAVTAGLSLGEYSALHAAGVFSAEELIRVTAFRGGAMERAARGRDCAMTAVMGLERAPLQEACRQASELGCVVIANDNCPGQLVLGGERAAVEEAARLAGERGARHCVPLRVSGPFHTPLMAPAGEELRQLFRSVAFRPMEIPVLFNCLGREMGPEDSIPELLVRQVQCGVRLTESIRRMAETGVDAVVEIGPGRALSGFVRRTVPGLPVCSVETAKDVEALPQWLEKEAHR